MLQQWSHLNGKASVSYNILGKLQGFKTGRKVTQTTFVPRRELRIDFTVLTTMLQQCLTALLKSVRVNSAGLELTTSSRFQRGIPLLQASVTDLI